jgi:hypothetical protein
MWGLEKDEMPKKTSQLSDGRSTYLLFTLLGDGHPYSFPSAHVCEYGNGPIGM